MAANERDSTGDWLLPATGGPPTMYEIEQRVEVALSVARAAETAALEIGAASIEAAQQARRAADLAERASAVVAGRGPAPVALAPQTNGNAHPAPVEEVAAPEPEPELVAAVLAEPGPVEVEPVEVEPEAPVEPEPEPDLFQERLLAFKDRAERVSVRLRRLDGATPISSA